MFQVLALTSLLCSLWTRLGVHNVIPPSETARVVSDESFMVSVMVVSTSPEGKEMMQTPRKFVAAVCVNGLEETAHDPDIHSQDMEVSGERDPENWSSNSS